MSKTKLGTHPDCYLVPIDTWAVTGTCWLHRITRCQHVQHWPFTVQCPMQLGLRLSEWTALLAWGRQHPNVCVCIASMLACLAKNKTERSLVPQYFQEKRCHVAPCGRYMHQNGMQLRLLSMSLHKQLDRLSLTVMHKGSWLSLL